MLALDQPRNKTTMPSNPNNCNNCGCTPNPLDSGNWESESTLGRSSSTSNTEPANWSPSPSGGGGDCKVGFKDSYVCKRFIDGAYNAGSNLHPDSNCKAEDLLWAIEEPAEGATIDGYGHVTFGPASAVITINVGCGDVVDSMTLRYAKIDWYEEEVVLEWHEQPSGVYPASSNVDLSKGGAMPDHWSLEIIESEETSQSGPQAKSMSDSGTDATINPTTGLITFGSEGQMFAVTGSIGGCILCAAVFKGTDIKLAIWLDGKDVTKKIKQDAAAGETYPLVSKVTPPSVGELGNPKWVISDKHAKEWRFGPNDAILILLDPEEYKSPDIEFFYIDGAPEGPQGLKAASISGEVTWKGKTLKLEAYTGFQVYRPDSKLHAGQMPLALVNERVDEDFVGIMSSLALTLLIGPTPKYGNLGVIQTGNAWVTRHYSDGSSNEIHAVGLDSKPGEVFQWDEAVQAALWSDKPAVSAYYPRVLIAESREEFTTFLMWHCKRARGTWVPLTKTTWGWYGDMEFDTGSMLWAQFAYGPDSVIQYLPEFNTTEYPEWNSRMGP